MKRLLTVALLGLIFTGCKKTEDDHSASSTNFTSYERYDINAQRLGSVGNVSDENHMEEWPQWVYDLFQPLDTANTTIYNWSEVNVDRLYPNPCGDTQTLRVFATQPVNLKVVIIDQFKNVYLRKSMHVFSTINEVPFSYRNVQMPSGYYRLFYSFSAADKPSFHRGHIDIYKTQ